MNLKNLCLVNACKKRPAYVNKNLHIFIYDEYTRKNTYIYNTNIHGKGMRCIHKPEGLLSWRGSVKRDQYMWKDLDTYVTNTSLDIYLNLKDFTMVDACRKRPVYVKTEVYTCIYDQYTRTETYLYDTNVHEKRLRYVMSLKDSCNGRCLSKETSICENRPIYMRPIHMKREICVRHQLYVRHQYTWKGT